MDTRTFVPWVVALLLALITLAITRKWSFAPKKSAAARMEKLSTQDKRDATDRLGDALSNALGLRLDTWKYELRWAQLGGHYQGKNAASVLGQSVLLGWGGLAYLLLSRNFSMLSLAGVALAAYYPYMTLRSRAGSVRDTVKRMLPEAAALISAEMSVRDSMDQAVERAATLPGALGVLLREAVDRARTESALLFSRDRVDGTIVRHFAELRFPPLEAFANRMDAIAVKGTDGPARMNDLAHDLATEYQVLVAIAAETLDNKLLLPMTIFFFLPLVAAVFIPLIFGVLQTF